MENPKKTRLNIDCSPEEKRIIRILAAKEDKSLSQYILSLVRRESESIPLNLRQNTVTTAIQQHSNTAKQPAGAL